MQEAALIILGAALGYLGARYLETLARKRARKTLATAVLAELRWLENILYQICEHGPTSFIDPLEHPMIEAALPHLLLFQPNTAEKLSHFHNLLRDVRGLMNRYRQNAKSVNTRTAEFVHFTRVKAYYAITAIAGLAEALRSEGGCMPPRIKEQQIEGRVLPDLPPRTFQSFRETGDFPNGSK